VIIGYPLIVTGTFGFHVRTDVLLSLDTSDD